MTSRFELTALFTGVDHGRIQARILELPGVITEAASRAEAEEMLGDALREYLLALGDLDGGRGEAPGGEQRRLAVTVAM